jgi:C1A family cysteine protease
MLLGGHAVTCVGYNDAKGVWIMKNSWGSRWGDKGHFYLPYAYLLSTRLSGDMWQITKVKVLTTAQKIMVYKKLETTKYIKK